MCCEAEEQTKILIGMCMTLLVEARSLRCFMSTPPSPAGACSLRGVMSTPHSPAGACSLRCIMSTPSSPAGCCSLRCIMSAHPLQQGRAPCAASEARATSAAGATVTSPHQKSPPSPHKKMHFLFPIRDQILIGRG